MSRDVDPDRRRGPAPAATWPCLDVPLVVDPARVRAVDQPDLRGDPSRLHEATDWVPEIDLDQTLADVLAYWRDREGI